MAIAVLLWGAALGAAGCAGQPNAGRTAEAGGEPKVASQTSVGDNTDTEECFTGGPPDVLQARIAVREQGSRQIVSLIDLEAQGPRRDAFRACHGLVARELELDSISQGALETEVLRPCSPDALPAGKLTAGAVLVDRRHNDALTMLGIEALGADERFACEPQAFEHVQVMTRRVGAFGDEAACERARAHLEQAMAMAHSRASIAALEWLQDQLEAQRTKVEQECAKAAKSPSCAQQRQLLDHLDDKRRELTEQPAERASDVSLTCHRAP